jgi:uncharacterized protein (TIGR00297 family)
MSFSHLFEPVPTRDWLIIAGLFMGIVILIALSELLRRRMNWSEEFNRKLVHILVGMLMFFIPILLQTSLPMVLIATFFTISNFIALRKGLLKGMHGARHSYGTVYYPLSFLILVLLCWPNHVIIIIASMIVLALGDAAAAIVGESISHPREYVLIEDRKSLQGSLTMFLVSALVIFLILLFYPFLESTLNIDSPWIALWFALLVAAITTAAEALGSKGSDNLSVPLLTALVLYFLLNHHLPEIQQFTIGTILAGFAAIFSYRLRFLTASGAVATFLLAAIIFGFGGWKWTVPILAFFILSSLLSRVGRAVKSRYDLIFEKGSRRDYAQVLANGGVAGALMILYMFIEQPQIYYLYLAALAAATADTWATEIGTLARQQPRLITTFRSVSAGTSGGITRAGLSGALGGAFIIALTGWMFSNPWSYLILFSITISGFFGSIVDSYLGATLQVQFSCPCCNNITEKKIHCGKNRTVPVSGLLWMNNDMVNFLNTVSGLFFLYILMNFIL